MGMFELAIDENDPHRFQSLMWHIIIVGQQGGLHRQEYITESHNKIQTIFYLMASK